MGGTIPTGTYFKFADWSYIGPAESAYPGGCDVDTYGDLIYVSSWESWPSHIEVYQVSLLDSDGDGVAERNQHPDNPDETGPIEERVFTRLDDIPLAGNEVGDVMQMQASEIFAYEDNLIVAGLHLTRIDLATYAQTVVATAPTWATGSVSGWGYSVSHIGYDPVHDEWFASNEGDRRVFRWHPASDSWGLAFRYPSLAGGHMDGLEVVTDPNTGIPYVYVSDMTSDFIAQYREDAESGWVQENVFAYAEPNAADVEGLGFGALGHFWSTSLDGRLYELGGGLLEDYLPDPAPAG